MSTTRREFLSGAGKLVLAGPLILPVLQACLPTSAPIAPTSSNSISLSATGTPVDLSNLSASNPFEVAPNLVGPDGFGVLVTLDNGKYHAFSQRCTHASCPVDSQLAGGDIHCSCHGSNFTLNGDVIAPSPAPTKLGEYKSILIASSNSLTVYPTLLS